MDLSNLGYSNDIEQPKDSLGGGFKIHPSDVYEAEIKLAYTTPSSKGGLNVNVIYALNDGSEYREIYFVMNQNGQNFYVKNDTKNYYPGFIHADHLALFATGKALSESKTEQKVVKLYNSEQKKEIPTEVPVFTDFIGKKVKLGLIQEKDLKSTQTSDGSYKYTDEEFEKNQTDVIFHATNNKTINECRAKVDEAEFQEKWLSKWKGKVKDTAKYRREKMGIKSGAPKTNTSDAPSKSSEELFQ